MCSKLSLQYAFCIIALQYEYLYSHNYGFCEAGFIFLCVALLILLTQLLLGTAYDMHSTLTALLVMRIGSMPHEPALCILCCICCADIVSMIRTLHSITSWVCLCVCLFVFTGLCDCMHERRRAALRSRGSASVGCHSSHCVLACPAEHYRTWMSC